MFRPRPDKDISPKGLLQVLRKRGHHVFHKRLAVRRMEGPAMENGDSAKIQINGWIACASQRSNLPPERSSSSHEGSDSSGTRGGSRHALHGRRPEGKMPEG